MSEQKHPVLDQLEDNIILIPLILSVVLTLIAFVVQTVSGTEAAAVFNRLSYYAYAWVCSLGIAVCARDRCHVRVALLEKALPQQGKRIMGILGDLISLVILIGMLWGCWQVLDAALDAGTMDSVATGVPVSIAYFAPVIGFALGTVRHIQSMVQGGKQ